MKKIFLFLFIIFNFPSVSLSENLKFKKIVSLDEPWGSSFLNDKELIVTEKSGKIKIIDLNLNKVIENCSNGKPRDALTSFENIYDNQSTTITLIRMFVNHFKLIEKILLLFEKNKNLENVINNIKPPIFFKKREFVIFQCKVNENTVLILFLFVIGVGHIS